MGAWDKLDTEITINVDTTDIDRAISGCDENFTDLIKSELIQIKKGYKKGCEEASKDIATRNRSFQQQEIGDTGKHPYASSKLSSSIVEEKKGDYTWLVGTRINHIYPLAVEYGRSAIKPRKAKVLFFYALSGEPVFTKHVGPAEPRPFVEPAFNITLNIAEEIVLRYIGRNLK